MYVIEAISLMKQYGGRSVVNGISFSVLSGQVCGFLGPNGSGKTTTIGMLLGTIRPTGGAVRLFGAADGMPLRDARRRIGAVLETPGLYSYLSAEDNLRISACVMGVSHARIGAVLDIVKLAPDRRLRVSKFSLGMRQRLSLAAALLSDPDLLILDEPTNGLDPEGIHDFRSVIRDLAAQQKTVFLSSHLLAEVNAVCTHVIVVNKGQIVRQLDVAGLTRTGVFTLGSADVIALHNAVLAYPGTVKATIVDRTVVAELSDSDPAQINRFLIASGVSLTEMTERRQSVEDIFLAAMRDSGTDKEVVA